MTGLESMGVGMRMGWMIAAAAAAMMAAGLGWAWWWMARRPFAVWAWAGRRALAKAGLRRVRVPSPVGAQTAWIGGSGPVLAFLHGVGHQAATWSRVAPALVDRFTVILPDLPGHGGSAPAQGPIEAEAIVAGLEAVLAGLARGRKITLVGNSLGGWMAMVLAHRHPDRFDRVVLVNGGALRNDGNQVNLLPANREEARAAFAGTRDPSAPPVPTALLDDLVRLAKVGPVPRFLATAATMEASMLTPEQVGELRLPVRLIWGVSDRLMNLDYARRLAELLPDAGLATLDRCGHVPQQEAPERFLEALLAALPPAGPE